MRHNAEHHSRPRSAAPAAFFKTTQALITAAILIGSVLGVCEMAWAQGQPIIFSVIGDVPYGTNEKADFQQHMDNHDLYSPAEFLVHVGDIKSGGSACDESWYRDMATSLRSLSVPAFIIPGDNEWNDCSDPDQAWAYWVAHLLAVDQNFCGVPLVERQAVRPENFAFVKSGVLFIGINKVHGGVSGAEEDTRLQQDADWITYQIQTKGSAVRAAVIFAQAYPSNPLTNQFVAAAGAFAKPVLYIHGDGHSWTQDFPFGQPNIMRIEVNRGAASDPPVQLTVTMNPANMFLVERDPWPAGALPLNRPPCVDAGPDLQTPFGDGVVLNGKASDDGEPIPPNLMVSWTQVGGPGIVLFDNASAPTTTALFTAAGSYTLRLTGTDGEFVTSDTVFVDVGAGATLNAPPVVTVTAPAGGSIYDQGQTVTLRGWAFDNEDGNLTASLSWTSNLNGFLGTGSTISTTTLSVGVHTITASVTDSGGKTGSQAITVTLVVVPIGPIPTTLEIRVATGADDAEESATGVVSVTGNDLELVADTSNQTVGMRFNGIAIPPWVVIDNAWIQFKADRTGSVATSLSIQGQAADSATTFTTAAANLSSRPKTSAAVPWSPVPWNTAGAAGPDQRTPDISSVIQEIVNRPGWASGNALAILITGTGQRAAESYEGLAAGAPLLHVEFVVDQIPPIVNAGPDQVVNLPNITFLDAAVSDDGLPNPPGTVTTTWTQVGGTGTATFADPYAIDTIVSFSDPDTYVLRLTAIDGGAYVRSDDVTVTVTLAGEIDVTPTSSDYGLVAAGTTSLAQTFTVTNLGIGDLVVGASTLTGPDAGSFAFVSGQAGFTIAPGVSNIIEVRFSPLTGGPKIAFLSIPSNDPSENPFLIPLTGVASVNTTPTFMEVKQGGSSTISVTTSTNLTGVNGHLYLAAVSTTPYRAVSTVTGLGLTWTPVAAQCAGRDQTGVALWWAQGAATTGAVTATLMSAATNTVLAVTRYSNVAATDAVGPLVAGNTNGINGACAGGIDSAAYSLAVTTSVNQALVVGAVARLNRTHTPGSGYTERVEAVRGTGTTTAGVAIVDRSVPVAMSLPLNGSLSGGVADWAVIGAELRPGTSVPMPDIDVLPNPHDYGVLPIGSVVSRTFAVRNLGTVNLQVTATSLVGGDAGEFAITLGGGPFTVAPGATHNLDVRFAPSVGFKTTTLRLTSTDPDENPVDVALSGTAIVPVPDIVVTPASYDFGTRRVGVTVTQSFTVSNPGTGNLVVGAPILLGSAVGSFTIMSGQAGFTIPPGGSNTITVRFLPLTGGAKTATLIIQSDDLDESPVFLPLTGTATVTTTPTFEEVQLGGLNGISVTTATSLTGITGHLYLTAVSTTPYRAVNTVTGLGIPWTRVATQCTGLGQTGIELWRAQGVPTTGTVTATLVSPATNAVIAVARYSGVAATNAVAPLVASNTNGVDGACAGGINSATYSFGVTTTVNETMVVGAVARLDRLHTPGAGYTERVEASQGSGLDTAGLAFVDRSVPTITSLLLNGSLNGTVDWGVIGIELRPSTSTPIPNITVVPNPHHDYGGVPVTTAATGTFAISNPGTTALQISSSSLVGGQASQFAITLGGAPFIVLPGTTRNLDVRFAPTSVGLKNTTLRLKSANAYEHPFDVTLSGTGLEASDIDVLPTAHNYGVVWFGATPSQTFAIGNVGNLDLLVTSAILVGGQAGEFAISLGGAPFTVVPGATHNLDVRYAPTLVGLNTTTLRLTTSDPDEPTVDVVLTGTGIAPPDIEITPAPYDFGQVLVGATATRTFVIRNLGGADLQVTASSLVGGQVGEFAITLGGAPFTLTTGATRNLDIRFSPLTGGPKATTLHLTSNDPDESLLDVALTATATTAPEINVAPTTHNYGVIWVGANASRTFTISNIGSADLQVTATSLVGADAGEFGITLGGGAFTLVPGATHNLDVNFVPTSTGPKVATLRLDTNDQDEAIVDVALSGTGIMPPDIDAAPTVHVYGDVLVGTNLSRTFVIRNLGGADLQVTSTSLVGGDVGQFAITSGGGAFTLVAGAIRNVDVRFAPTSGGPKTTTLRLATNDPDESSVDVTASGTATTAPEIDVIPNPHNYGSVVLGTSPSRTFAIRNVGSADLHVSSTTLVGGNTAEFAITSGGGSFTVLPGATHNLDVRFTPADLGLKTTTLGLTSDDQDESILNVALSGTGIILIPDINVTPTSHDYGTQSVGTSVTHAFTVSNTGNGDVVVGTSTLTGPDAGAFAFVSGKAGFTIAPGASNLIEVRFNAPTSGPKSATLTIPSNDPDENPISIQLTGTGGPITPPAFVEMRQGGSAGSVNVTTSANLTGVNGHLYLAAVSTRPTRTVNSVTGLGLTWTRAAAQCGGQNLTGVELWWAQGAATTGTVGATLASAPTSAVIAVTRYSGVAPTNPVAPLVRGNMNGVNGACSGGTDGAAYSFNVTTTSIQSVVIGAVAVRQQTHTPGAGYTERAEVGQGTGTSRAGLVLVEQAVPASTSLALNGSLSNTTDWAVIGVQVRPNTGVPIADIDINPNPEHDYGDVFVGATAARTFAIRNLGGADLHVGASSLVGGLAGEFAITLGGAPFTVAPGATQNVDVRFAPTSGGPKSTTLRFTSDDPDESPIDVALSGNGVVAPEIDVVPAASNYGVVWLGANASRTFTIRNLGSADLQVTATSLVGGDAGEFGITSGAGSFTLTPGATHDVDVRFAPTAVGPKTAALRLANNDDNEGSFDVSLTGTGITPPDVDVTPSPYDYGAVLVGANASRTFVIRNLGGADLQVTATSLVGGDAGQFAITQGGGSFALAAGATHNLEVRFAPTSGGLKSAMLRLTSNDPDESPIDVALSGTATTAPEIDVVPTVHNYGVIWVGANASRTFAIRNIGSADLQVTATSLVGADAGEFAITLGGGSFTVVPGATHNLDVSVVPTSAGSKTAILRLTSTDQDEATFDVALSGTGIMPPDIDVAPSPYDYGAVLLGTTTSRTFVIRNLGVADLQVTATSLVGGDAGQFAIMLGGGSFTLAAGATHNLDVRFAPSSGGLKTTMLRLTSNDPDESPVDVALSGTGTTAPEIDVVPTVHNYGLVVVAATASRTIAVRNVGSADLQVTTTSLVGGDIGEFAITQGGGPFTVTPGATHNLDVHFTPTSIGPKTTTLRLTSDDQDENIVDVALSGTGTILVPDVAVTPTSHGYGTQSVGTSVTQSFSVSNTGTGNLVVGTSTLTGPDAGAFAFVSGQAGFTIAPAASSLIEVRFSPTTVGLKSATLTIPSDDPDENPFVIPLTGTGGPATPPTFVEVRQGGSASASSVTTATNLTGVTGHLYLAAVSTKPYRAVNVVTGLGLTWTRVATQCAGRNQTGIELWWAQGAATTGTVTATLASAPTNALIAVARYSGVAATSPVAPLAAGNTNGINGACANGVDSAAYSFNVTTTQSNALVVGAVAIRTKTHTPGAGYTERAEVVQSSGANMVTIAFFDRAVPVTTSLLLNGSLSGAVDWAVMGIQLRP